MFFCSPEWVIYYLGVVAAQHFFEILLHLLIIHLQLHAFSLELPPHLVDLGRVLLDLLWIERELPFNVFSGYFGLGGSEPI